jgi:Kef-type K+ transport system membrane component KefB
MNRKQWWEWFFFGVLLFGGLIADYILRYSKHGSVDQEIIGAIIVCLGFFALFTVVTITYGIPSSRLGAFASGITATWFVPLAGAIIRIWWTGWAG